MSRQIQFRRGTAAEHENFTGAVGEITVDTTNNTLRVHDGATIGGTPMARADTVTDMTGTDYVVAWQTPTSDNGYTWYRKYKSGWVEQGGRIRVGELTTGTQNITLPIEMSDNQYWCTLSWVGREGNSGAYSGITKSDNSTPTTLVVQIYLSGVHTMYWQVSGMSAE